MNENVNRDGATGIPLAAIAVAVLIALPAAPAQHYVPLLISAANNAAGQQGFVRVINHTDRAGTMMVRAIDDTGATFGSDVISLAAWQAMHFNSDDLEMGNASKGFAGVGSGTGDWRLQIESDLRLEVLAYVRTSDGFLTAIHGEARHPGLWHLVPIFNPGSNTNQVSKLRLINQMEAAASVAVVGVDDSGEIFQASVTVPAERALTISAQQLESGDELRDGGGLGNGVGKWRLHVAADAPISVMSLMETPTGHITNLAYSTSAEDPSLPEQITPPRASGSLRLGWGWSSYRIAYVRGHFLLALMRSRSTSHFIGAIDAFGRPAKTRYFDGLDDHRRAHGLSYGGQGVLYFSFPSYERIVAYDLDGRHRNRIDLPWSPYEIAFGKGDLFVVAWMDGEPQVRRLSLAGEEVGVPFPLSTRNENPTGMTYWDGHLYVVDEEKEKVFVYSIASGERKEGMEFELDPDNDVPQGIEYANGRFYVPDTNDRGVIYAYTPRGEVVEAQSHLAFGEQREPIGFPIGSTE